GQARNKHRDPIDRRLEQDRLDEGARSKRVMKGIALAVITALPTTSAAKVASIKLLTAAAESATRGWVVSTMQLQPTKKKMVGGKAGRSPCSSRAPTRYGTMANAPARPADGSLYGARPSCGRGSLFMGWASRCRGEPGWDMSCNSTYLYVAAL